MIAVEDEIYFLRKQNEKIVSTLKECHKHFDWLRNRTVTDDLPLTSFELQILTNETLNNLTNDKL